MCNTLGPQKEAWWMLHPEINWSDQSMSDAVRSVAGNGDPVPDFLFNTSELDPLQDYYIDIFCNMIGLPVCDLPTSFPTTSQPEHSGVLVDWFTPPGLSASFSAGVFEAKWGDAGIYRYRWGIGLCPPGFCAIGESLHIFVPTWDPPFDIVHTPWGE
jgi:hypothetical protein